MVNNDSNKNIPYILFTLHNINNIVPFLFSWPRILREGAFYFTTHKLFDIHFYYHRSLGSLFSSL
jgi:ubiquinone/menaquinone biosynthesis C-methylase UbiE